MSPTADLVASANIRERWADFDLEQKRAVLREVMVVTVHRSSVRGRRFDASSIEIVWRSPEV